MAWIKRNLFFVIGGVVAIALLGAGGFDIYAGWSHNSDASVKLNEIYGTLRSLQQEKPGPGNTKIDNTQIAREQFKQLQEWIGSAQNYFQPIPAIPSGDVTSEAYAGDLRRTIALLQHQAEVSAVTLPPNYDFSFSAQRPLVQFAPGSLGPLATQLGEVKAIAETVFSARINALDGIQRVRVSDDDVSGPAGDYIDDQPVTNGLAVITPYVVTFRCFTPELARVISAFANSSNTFLIKAINVQPAAAAAAAAAGAGLPGGLPPGAMAGRYPGAYGAPPVQTPVQARGALQTVLNEQILRVSLEVGIVKLLPTS
jgi:hypothetical protein